MTCTSAKKAENAAARPVSCLVTASFLYGIIPCFVKVATQIANVPTYLFISNGIAFLLANLALTFRGVSRRVERGVLKDVLLFGCLSTLGTSALLTISYQYISTGAATMIHFAYPALVTVAMAVLFRERLSAAKIATVLCALGGVVLIAGLPKGLTGSVPLFGILCALGSSVTYGIFVIANDKSRFARLDPFVLFFYLTGVSMVTFGCYAFFTGSLSFPASPLPYVMALCQQGSNMGAVVLFALGVRKTGASTGAVINMLEPAVSMLSGVLLFQDAVTPATFAGCVLILCSVVAASLKGGKPPLGK